MALARLSGHKNANGVVLPHRVFLEMPQNRMSMTMDLGNIQVNPQSIPPEIWEMPESPGYQIVHLDAGVRPTHIGIRPESASHLNSQEMEPSPYDDDAYASPPAVREFERPLDRSGRARLLDESAESDSPFAANVEEEWAR